MRNIKPLHTYDAERIAKLPENETGKIPCITTQDTIMDWIAEYFDSEMPIAEQLMAFMELSKGQADPNRVVEKLQSLYRAALEESPLPPEHYTAAAQEVIDVVSAKEWTWSRNHHCKYISLRIDTRDGKCIIKDRHGEVITLDEVKRQRK